MAGKEFTGKDKTVQKMTRDGLTEENLHDGSVKNISKLDREGRPSKSFEMSLDHRHVNTASEDSAGKRNKKYRDKSGLAAEERIRSRDAPVDQMDIGPEENGVDGVGTEEAGTGRASQRRLMNYAGMHKKSAVADRTETVTETRTVRVGESLGQVVTSGYCNCRICCGQWSGGPTASGAYPTANHTIAVDANNPTVPMGTKVVMNGVEYTVEDTGAFARYGVDFEGNWI